MFGRNKRENTTALILLLALLVELIESIARHQTWNNRVEP